MLGAADRLAHLEGRVVEQSETFGRIDSRFTALENRIDHRFAVLEGEIGGLRRDLTTQFRWTTGMLLTGFIAVFTAIITR